MPAPTNIKKNGVLLVAGDPCPKACANPIGSAVHLVSDHSIANLGQCTKCSCVIQTVDNHIGRQAAKVGA